MGKGIDEKIAAVDGKTMKGSADMATNQRMKQILSVFGTVGRVILAHVEIDQKTNEIPAAQELILALGLKDRLYTFDAMHCQVKTFEAAIAVGSHVLVQVKDNQEGLVDAVESIRSHELASPDQRNYRQDRARQGGDAARGDVRSGRDSARRSGSRMRAWRFVSPVLDARGCLATGGAGKPLSKSRGTSPTVSVGGLATMPRPYVITGA